MPGWRCTLLPPIKSFITLQDGLDASIISTPCFCFLLQDRLDSIGILTGIFEDHGSLILNSPFNCKWEKNGEIGETLHSECCHNFERKLRNPTISSPTSAVLTMNWWFENTNLQVLKKSARLSLLLAEMNLLMKKIVLCLCSQLGFKNCGCVFTSLVLDHERIFLKLYQMKWIGGRIIGVYVHGATTMPCFKYRSFWQKLKKIGIQDVLQQSPPTINF